jgi:hypothetical protein
MTHILILLLFPFVYFDVFLTPWLRFPPHIIIVLTLVLFHRNYLKPSRQLLTRFMFFFVLNLAFKVFYSHELFDFLVNAIKITTFFLIVVYFSNKGKIKRLVNYCIVLSSISFFVYLVGFYSMDINVIIRSVFLGSSDALQDWAGLTNSQFQFGYELIPLVVFLLINKSIYKLIGLLVILTSPQRSVLSSILALFNFKKSTIIFVVLTLSFLVANSNEIEDWVLASFEFSIIKKNQASNEIGFSRFQMIQDGILLLLNYPFGGILHQINWEEAVLFQNILVFKENWVVLAPHNVVIYTLFVFGIIPGMFIIYYYLNVFLKGFEHIAHNTHLKLVFFISVVLFFNAFFHNACFLTSHSITLIFYFIYLEVLDDVKNQRKNLHLIPN